MVLIKTSSMANQGNWSFVYAYAEQFSIPLADGKDNKREFEFQQVQLE